jgi:hypothetical protein
MKKTILLIFANLVLGFIIYTAEIGNAFAGFKTGFAYIACSLQSEAPTNSAVRILDPLREQRI